MTRVKYPPPDHVEQAGRAAVASLRKAPPAGKDGAMARGELIHLAPRDPEQERKAAVTVAWFALRAEWGHPEIRDVLDGLGLLPKPEAVTAVPARRLAERPQMTGGPTRQQQEMAERIAAFAAHRAAGLNEVDAARVMGLSRKTARRYAAALGGTGGAS